MRDPERDVDAMAADIDVLARLVDDLFTLARIERGELALQPEPVDLAELADTTVASFEAFAQRRDLALTLSVEGDTTAVVDPHAIGRVSTRSPAGASPCGCLADGRRRIDRHDDAT